MFKTKVLFVYELRWRPEWKSAERIPPPKPNRQSIDPDPILIQHYGNQLDQDFYLDSHQIVLISIHYYLRNVRKCYLAMFKKVRRKNTWIRPFTPISIKSYRVYSRFRNILRWSFMEICAILFAQSCKQTNRININGEKMGIQHVC